MTPLLENYLFEYARSLPVAFTVIAMAGVLVAVAWLVRNATTPQDDHAVLRSGNTAIAIERGGFLLAHVVAMVFAIAAFDGETPWVSVGLLGIKFALTSTLLLVLLPLVDWAVLPKIANNDLLLEGNVAVAVVMAKVYLALGVVVGASTVGSAKNMMIAVLSTAVFAVAGVVVVLLATRLHVAITHRGDNTDEEMRAGRLAPALDLGSLVLALGIIVSVGVAGDLGTWVDGFSAFAATTVIGLAVLYATQWLVNRMLTRGASSSSVRREGNLAMSAVVACGRIGLGLLVAAVLARVV